MGFSPAGRHAAQAVPSSAKSTRKVTNDGDPASDRDESTTIEPVDAQPEPAARPVAVPEPETAEARLPREPETAEAAAEPMQLYRDVFGIEEPKRRRRWRR
jgi:hypothetical protein